MSKHTQERSQGLQGRVEAKELKGESEETELIIIGEDDAQHSADDRTQGAEDEPVQKREAPEQKGEHDAESLGVDVPPMTESNPQETAQMQPAILEQLEHADEELPTEPMVPASTVQDAYGMEKVGSKQRDKPYENPETVSLEPMDSDSE